MRFLKWLMKWWKPAGRPIEDWAKQRREVKGPDVSSWFDICGEKPPEGVPLGEWAKARRYTVFKEDIGPFDIKSIPPGAKVSFFKAAAVGATTALHMRCMQINTQLWAREVLGTDFISKRTLDWFEFAGEVARHVENYVVAQYGDAGDDPISDYSPKDCFRQVKKYMDRFGRNQRPGQQELDFFKMAHYIQLAQVLYSKSQAPDGPCSFCGSSEHWRPDCPKIAEVMSSNDKKKNNQSS